MLAEDSFMAIMHKVMNIQKYYRVRLFLITRLQIFVSVCFHVHADVLFDESFVLMTSLSISNPVVTLSAIKWKSSSLLASTLKIYAVTIFRPDATIRS